MVDLPQYDSPARKDPLKCSTTVKLEDIKQMNNNLADIEFDQNSEQPNHLQMAAFLQQSIINGDISPGERLPSIRQVASSCGVSRSTVWRCFEQLASKGYVVVEKGLGTFVCEQLPGVAVHRILDSAELGETFIGRAEPRLSIYAKRLMRMEQTFAGTAPQPLLDEVSHDELTAMETWSRIFRRHAPKSAEGVSLTDRDPMGAESLRLAYSNYVRQALAVNCSADQVMVSFAGELRYDIISRILLDKGDLVAFEDPGYPIARDIFSANGAEMVPIPVDNQGLRIEALEAIGSPVKLIYVTPSQHVPTGATLSSRRRSKLLDYAKKNDAFIVEDDFDCGYRHIGRLLPSLQSMDDSGRVIYLSSFSNPLDPVAKKIGFLILPDRLVDAVSRAKALVEPDMPVAEQHAWRDFIVEGHLDATTRRSREIYAGRCKAFQRAMQKTFGQGSISSLAGSGTDMLVFLKSALADEEVVERGRRIGIPIVSAGAYYFSGEAKGEFLIAFGKLHEDDVAAKLSMLASAI